MIPRRILFAAAVVAIPTFAMPQTNFSFGGLSVDATAPVEMTSDNLQVDQATGNAHFNGNVVIGQGDLRLSADSVIVDYSDAGGVDVLNASGNVTLVTATQAAEAAVAIYSLVERTITLQGDVMLTQGQSALLADSMTVDLETGNAVMNGRVRSILQPSAN